MTLLQSAACGATTQTISFGALPNQAFGTAPFGVSATSSSGLTVSFASTTASVCTVSGSTVTLAAVGICTIQATQAGNGTYAAATPVNQSFQVTQTSQTISFGALPNRALGSAPFIVGASASSGLAVSFASTTAPVCTVSGNTVTLVAVGTCTIQATQAGNATYAAATPVNQSFAVTAGLQFVPVTPCRVMDTRNTPSGTFAGPYIAGGSSRSIPIPSSNCGIPSNAAAYSLNVTVVPRTGVLDYLTVWPTGQSQPGVSTLNSYEGAVLANAAIVPAGTGGSIAVYATADTDLLIDINGYFVAHTTESLQFYPLTSCRILDTRNTPNGTFAGPSLAGGSTRSFPIPSSGCDVPSGAGAYALNVTVVPQGELDYLTAWPTGESQPGVSTMNSYAGTVLANAAIIPAGSGGAVSFYASNATDLVVDINGYFAAPAAGGLNFYTVTPCRIADTRGSDGTFGGPIMGSSTSRTFPLSQGPCGTGHRGGVFSQRDGGTVGGPRLPDHLAYGGWDAGGVDVELVRQSGSGELGNRPSRDGWRSQRVRNEHHARHRRQQRVFPIRRRSAYDNGRNREEVKRYVPSNWLDGCGAALGLAGVCRCGLGTDARHEPG
ncbi:MAG: hypothetical protein ABSH56_23645 [Bryobacteraceae bacterium]